MELLEGAVGREELLKNTPTEALTGIIMNNYYGAVAVWCITGGDASLFDSMEHFCEYGLKTMIDQYRR